MAPPSEGQDESSSLPSPDTDERPISYVKSYSFHSPRMRERGESVDLESVGGDSLDEGLDVGKLR